MIEAKDVKPGEKFLLIVPDPIPEKFKAPPVHPDDASLEESLQNWTDLNGSVVTVDDVDGESTTECTNGIDAWVEESDTSIPLEWLYPINDGAKFVVRVPDPIPDGIFFTDGAWRAGVKALNGMTVSIMRRDYFDGPTYVRKSDGVETVGVAESTFNVPVEWLSPPVAVAKGAAPRFKAGDAVRTDFSMMKGEFPWPNDTVFIVNRVEDVPVATWSGGTRNLKQTQSVYLTIPGRGEVSFADFWLEPATDFRKGDHVKVFEVGGAFPENAAKIIGRVYEVDDAGKKYSDGEQGQMILKNEPRYGYASNWLQHVGINEPLTGGAEQKESGTPINDIEHERRACRKAREERDAAIKERDEAQACYKTAIDEMNKARGALLPAQREAEMYGADNVRLKKAYDEMGARSAQYLLDMEKGIRELDLEREANLRLRYELSTRPLPRPPESLLERGVKRVKSEVGYVLGLAIWAVMSVAMLGWRSVKGASRGARNWFKDQIQRSEFLNERGEALVLGVAFLVFMPVLCGVLLTGSVYAFASHCSERPSWELDRVEAVVCPAPHPTQETDARVREWIEAKKARRWM